MTLYKAVYLFDRYEVSTSIRICFSFVFFFQITKTNGHRRKDTPATRSINNWVTLKNL